MPNVEDNELEIPELSPEWFQRAAQPSAGLSLTSTPYRAQPEWPTFHWLEQTLVEFRLRQREARWVRALLALAGLVACGLVLESLALSALAALLRSSSPRALHTVVGMGCAGYAILLGVWLISHVYESGRLRPGELAAARGAARRWINRERASGRDLAEYADVRSQGRWDSEAEALSRARLEAEVEHALVSTEVTSRRGELRN